MGSVLRTDVPDIKVQEDPVQGSQGPSPSPSSDRATAAQNSVRRDLESAATSPSPAPSPRWWVDWFARNPVRSDSWMMLPARQESRYQKLSWLSLIAAVACLLVALLVAWLSESALWCFLFLFAGAICSGMAEDKKPAAIARRKAIRLQPVLEKQVRDWEVIIKEVSRLRRWLRRRSHYELLDECDRLLKGAKRELRDSRSRLKEHRVAFNTAYWVYQHLDQRGLPRYEYMIHRGLCYSCNSGKSKPSMWVGFDGTSRRWNGPYDEWRQAQASGVGKRRCCWVCCPDLRRMASDENRESEA